MAKIDLTTQVRGILPIQDGGTGTMDGANLPQFADNETPSGTLDGVNKVFSLAHTPNPLGSLLQFIGPALNLQGIDYTLSGNVITFTSAPAPASNLRAWYRWNVAAFVQSILEQMQMSDMFLLGYGNKFSETLVMSDQFSWAYQLSESGADTLSMSTSIVIGYGNVEADTLTLSDVMKLGYGCILLDGFGMLDSIAFELVGGAADQFLLFDTLKVMKESAQISVGLQISEQILLSDLFQFDDPTSESLSDTMATLSDSCTFTIGMAEKLSDTMTLSDSSARIVSGAIARADTMVLSDAVSIWLNYAPAETLTISDSIRLGYGLLIAETMTMTDSLTTPLSLFDFAEVFDQLGFGNQSFGGSSFGGFVNDPDSINANGYGHWQESVVLQLGATQMLVFADGFISVVVLGVTAGVTTAVQTNIDAPLDPFAYEFNPTVLYLIDNAQYNWNDAVAKTLS